MKIWQNDLVKRSLSLSAIEMLTSFVRDNYDSGSPQTMIQGF